MALGLLFVLADEFIEQYHAAASVGLIEGFPIMRSLIAELSTLGSFGGEIKVLEERQEVMLAAGRAGKETRFPDFRVVLEFG